MIDTDWLRTAMTEYEKSESRWAFLPYTLRIGNRQELAYDMRPFIEGLPDDEQAQWHEAILELVDEFKDMEHLAVVCGLIEDPVITEFKRNNKQEIE